MVVKVDRSQVQDMNRAYDGTSYEDDEDDCVEHLSEQAIDYVIRGAAAAVAAAAVAGGGVHHHNNNTDNSENVRKRKKKNPNPQPRRDVDLEDGEDTEEGQIFGSKADLQLHTQIHMREAKPYKCAQCSKAFANSSYLSQHTRIHLGIKPYKCEICQRKFTQLSHLQQHIRTHTGDKPYKCRHHGCTKAFSQLSNLQSHSRCHQTDKPYKCNSCYKCFIDENALLDHIPKHKESKHLKTHICQFCGKSYTQETYLAKHMQKHSDRPEKRSSGLLSSGGVSGNGGQAGGLGGGVVGSGNAGSVGSQSGHGLSSAAVAAAAANADSYWSKMDPATAYAHDRAAAAADYAVAQSAALMDPRLNPHHRDMMVDPRHATMEDLRAVHHSQLSAAGGHGLGGYVDHSAKTSSAFSPIQGSMLQTAGGGFPMGGSRGYSFYDPIGFPKHHSQVGFESKTSGANCFPNQLISLSQIRNYAHQPSSDLLHSLKEKAGQVSQ